MAPSRDGETSTLPDGGYDGALAAAVTEHEAGIEPDTLCGPAAPAAGSGRRSRRPAR
ncbi:hypothetical protein ACIRG5_08625 [Lentzea sp. NPDC102401]|uniref:hypothetical protein n=1 Tax=Lentzea sp. NPDC102401 TaxID=3364128 RepID=UPI00380A2DB7